MSQPPPGGFSPSGRTAGRRATRRRRVRAARPPAPQQPPPGYQPPGAYQPASPGLPRPAAGSRPTARILRSRDHHPAINRVRRPGTSRDRRPATTGPTARIPAGTTTRLPAGTAARIPAGPAARVSRPPPGYQAPPPGYGPPAGYPATTARLRPAGRVTQRLGCRRYGPPGGYAAAGRLSAAARRRRLEGELRCLQGDDRGLGRARRSLLTLIASFFSFWSVSVDRLHRGSVGLNGWSPWWWIPILLAVAVGVVYAPADVRGAERTGQAGMAGLRQRRPPSS